MHSLRRTALSEKYFIELPKHHQQLLTGFSDHLAAVRTCIEHNFVIIKLLIADTDHMFENRLDYFDTVSILSHLTHFCCVFWFICQQNFTKVAREFSWPLNTKQLVTSLEIWC